MHLFMMSSNEYILWFSRHYVTADISWQIIHHICDSSRTP